MGQPPLSPKRKGRAMLRIMSVGDVTSPSAARALADRLWEIRRAHRVDFVAVNAENAGTVIGPSPEIAKLLLDKGADCLTGGNHTLQATAFHAMLESDGRVLRPLNYPPEAPGTGYTVQDAKGYRLLIVNAMGRVHMEPPLDSPFTAIERVLAREEGNYDLAILDIHAEATGEKLALAMHFDGRFSAIYGTHTHVPTADLTLLPKGTGYVSDIGMCGARGGILGINAEMVIRRFLTALPTRLSAAEGELYADAVIFDVDERTGRATALERLSIPLS